MYASHAPAAFFSARHLFMFAMVTLLFCGAARAQDATLALAGIFPSYQGNVGRSVSLRVRYDTLVEVFIDEEDGEEVIVECSAVDPANVMLVLELQGGAIFVAESRGNGVYDPATHTVTWDLGTLVLDPLTECREFVEVELEIDASVADGATLDATARISTTSPGDDPADNEATVEFQVGYLPMTVFATAFNARCAAGGTSDSRPPFGFGSLETDSIDGNNSVSCEAPFAPAIVVPGIAHAHAGTTAPGAFNTSGSGNVDLGKIDIDGALTLPTVSAHTSTTGGFICDLTSCDPLAKAGIARVVRYGYSIVNPNPYGVPITVRDTRRVAAHCAPSAALAGPSTARATDELSGMSVRCGESSQQPSLLVRLDADRTRCDVSVNNDVIRSLSPNACFTSTLVGGGGGMGLPVFDVDSGADTEIEGGSGGTVLTIRRGASGASVRSRVQVAFGNASFAPVAHELKVTALSPVDLLLTDPGGSRTGADPGTDGPPLQEIAGADYSGADSDPETINVILPSPGVYQLDILGTDSGSYGTTIVTVDDNGTILDQLANTGVAAPGRSEVREFLLRSNGALLSLDGSSADVVNDDLTVAPQVDVAFAPSPAPDAPAGVFTISATFSNTSADSLVNLFFTVTELTGGNLLLNADGGPGSVGATLTPALPSGDLRPGESFVVDFAIGLASRSEFEFFVDAFGVTP